jgi:nucleotide-binding universal stress UspA family protein
MQTLANAASANADEVGARPLATAPIASPGTLQSLLVHMDAGPHAVTRVRAARRLAHAFDATVTACYAATPLIATLASSMDFAGAGPAFAILEEIDRSRRALALSRVEGLRDEPGAPLAWHEVGGIQQVRSLAHRSLYADLLVLGQATPLSTDWGVPGDFVEAVLVESGTPALVLPYVEVQKTIGERVLVAWKETAASGRALRAALPLLRRAAEVHVVAWGAEAFDPDPNAITGFLQRHGVESRLIHSATAPDDAGERLLSLAADLSADLMVMGCYGHSRAREFVLGGATRTVLRSMTLPVLMAH